jgi:DMSO/TMAO reductase YedYZ molybdopterin-dependent catalytic subunit
MPTALHSQTQLTFYFDGEVLPRKYCFPMKLRIPTTLGFKNPKHIGEIGIGNEFNGSCWETLAIIGSAGSQPAVGACALKRYRLIKNASRPRRRRRMRAALCRDVKISRKQLQIAHDEIAFEHETLLMAFGVKVRAIV